MVHDTIGFKSGSLAASAAATAALERRAASSLVAPASAPASASAPTSVLTADLRARFASGLQSAMVRDEDAFARLETDWRDLEERVPGSEYFTSFDWAWCWWHHFGRRENAGLSIVTVRRAGELVAVMPLAIVRTGPYTHALLLGAGTGQYSDILLDPACPNRDGVLAELWSALEGLGVDAFQADNVRDDSDLAELLAPRRKCAGNAEPSFEVVTSDFEDFDAYMATRSSRQRKDLRRRRRRLAEEGSPAYQVIEHPDRVADEAVVAIALKRTWLAERGLHGRFLARPEVDAWMADVTVRALDAGRLHLSVLQVGNGTVASQIAFSSHGRLVAYFGAFDVAFSRHAVGKLHLEEHLCDVFGSGLTVDLLPPGDDYKVEWATPGVVARSYTVPVSALGRIVTTIHNPSQRERLKRAYLAMPTGLRAGVAAGILRTSGAMGRLVRGGQREVAGDTNPDANET